MRRTLDNVRVRIAGLLLLVVTVSTVLAEEPLQVAFIYPQAPSNAVLNTYDYAIAGEAGRRGAELANEQFGWAAQQQGIDFRVLMNSAPSAASAVRAAERLIQNEDVFAIIGGFDSAQARALADLAAQRDVLFFNVGSTDHAPQPAANTFHLQPSVETYLRAIRQLAVDAADAAWLVVHAADEEGERRLEAAKEVLFAGVTPAADSVDSGAPVFQGVLATIRETEPDKVLLLLDWRLQLEFLTQLESSGLELPEIWAVPDAVAVSREFYGLLRSGAPEAGHGPHIALWEATLDGEAAATLNELYESRFGEAMDPAAWSTFEAVRLAFEAVSAVGTTEAQDLIDHLLSADRELTVDKDQPVSFDVTTRELKQPLYATVLADRKLEGSRLDMLRARAQVAHVLTLEEIW